MAIQLAQGADEAVSSINTTPLVDVMLVLLIIFLITIPVVNFSVPVELPKLRNEVRESEPRNVVVTVARGGQLYWFDAPIAGKDALFERLKGVAQQQPQPEVHVRGDAGSDYAPVGRVLLAAQRAGIAKVGFITEPPARSP
jgi:biopolymer transport protein ExbD